MNFFLNIKENVHLHPKQSLLESQMDIFSPKDHSTTCYDVIWFGTLASPIPNSVLKFRHIRILRYTSWYGMSPGSPKSINTTSNGVSDSTIWIIWRASWDHEFTNCKFSQDLINWSTSLLTIGHQNRASILNKVLCSWLCPANGDKCYNDINTSVKFKSNTIKLSCLTLAVSGVS